MEWVNNLWLHVLWKLSLNKLSYASIDTFKLFVKDFSHLCGGTKFSHNFCRTRIQSILFSKATCYNFFVFLIGSILVSIFHRDIMNDIIYLEVFFPSGFKPILKSGVYHQKLKIIYWAVFIEGEIFDDILLQNKFE